MAAKKLTDAQRRALDYARRHGRITANSAVADSRGHLRTVLVPTLKALERMGYIKRHSEFSFNGWVLVGPRDHGDVYQAGDGTWRYNDD